MQNQRIVTPLQLVVFNPDRDLKSELWNRLPSASAADTFERSLAECGGRTAAARARLPLSEFLSLLTATFTGNDRLRHAGCPWAVHLEGPMLRLTWTTFGLALVGVCLLVARTAAADLLASLLTR
jgi:hypothetical protein